MTYEKSTESGFTGCKVTQTDGGSEFKGEFRKMVVRYYERHRYARPYKKNEQAYLKKVIGTLRNESVGWVKYKKEQIEEVEQMIEEYLHYYRVKRPHMGLNMKRPIEMIRFCRICDDRVR